MITTSIGNLILILFLGLVMLCAAAVIVVVILSLMGAFGLGVQISSEPAIHREITKGELAFILLLAVVLAATSFFFLRRIYAG